MARPATGPARILEQGATHFLVGGGEMGERMRALDWSKTPVGPAERWPQSLRSPLSMLLPSKAQMILFWGPEFVVFYNDAYRVVFGAKHPHVLGKPGREAWSEIWDSMLHELLAGVVRTGEAFSAADKEFLLERHGFPEETYFDVSYDPVRDEAGKVGGVLCIVTETTGRVVGERRLALLRELATRDAGARTPRDACRLAMETLAANPQDVPFAMVHLGDELQASTPDAEALAASHPQRVKQIPLAAAQTAGKRGVLVAGLNPRRPFDEQYRTFLELVGGQIATAIANADAYEQERKRSEALAELDRAKTAFFSNVSHEFRTPLTLMLGPLEDLLARDAELSGDARAQLRTAQRNGQRLLKLVNTLLDFARIEAGRTQAAYEPTDLAALTAELASNFRSACERAGLALVLDCPRLAEPTYVDREMWEKIVLNLVSNAFKFTLAGSIEVRLADLGERVRLTVRDSGIGIPRASLGHVFERFHRVEGARGRSHEGSGIGLALVHELVRLHGGTIRVESEPGRGSTFTVELPKGNAHLPAERLRGPSGPAPAAARAGAYVAEALSWLPQEPAAAPTARPLDAPHVLVADDNGDLRDYVRRLLAEHYDVAAVADGREALDAARARRPDLVVCDVMMPNLDGFGLIAQMRSDPTLRDVPVVALSARAGEEARLEGLNRGADDYLVKPFSARELLVRVGSLLASAEVRRQAFDAVRQSSARFETLLARAPMGVYLVDADFRIREVNPVAGPAFADVPGGVIGRDLGEVFQLLTEKPQADEITAIFRRTLETGEPFVATEWKRRRSGSDAPIYYEWRLDRIPLPDGRNGVVCYFRDISAHVLARKALEESREALREADRRKDEFLATLSHELRNPLAPMRNALHLLRIDHVGQGGYARDVLERQFDHMVRLVDDLMEMSRINSGKLELRRQRVELSTVVRNAVETSEPLIKAARHRLDVSMPGEPLWVDGDPVRLAQILSNLLNNSAKYTPHGGTISLSARREGSQACLRVRDDGHGIDAARLPRLFDLFHRGDGALERAAGGLGIGLPLARRLAEMHGGTLEGHSEGRGRGAEFVVRLPLVQPATRWSAPIPERSTAVPTALRVLLVDDNRDAATSLGMLLEALGASVQVAFDGASALEQFGAVDPEIVLLDLGMPGMDGYEVVRRLRERHPDHGAVLVALTGWGQEEDRRRVREAGFHHHLVKPPDLDALQILLERAARGR